MKRNLTRSFDEVTDQNIDSINAEPKCETPPASEPICETPPADEPKCETPPAEGIVCINIHVCGFVKYKSE